MSAQNTENPIIYSHHEAAELLGLPLISFKNLAKRVDGEPLTTPVITPEDFERYKAAHEAEQAKPGLAVVKPGNPTQSMQITPETANLSPDKAMTKALTMQAYQKGRRQAELAYAVQTRAFQAHLKELTEGKTTVSPTITDDEIAAEIAAIEAELQGGN